MNTALVVWCLSIAISYALILRENVAFRKTNEISVSRSTWKVTLVLDLKPYQDLLDHSLESIKEIEEFLNSKQTFFKVDLFTMHFQTLENELTLLSKSREKIVNSYSQFKVFQSRSRRSVLPFLGDILSFVAGTPSESDLTSIRNNVKALTNNQGKLEHVIRESLSLINMTHERVVENRERINKINDGMQELIMALNNVQNEMRKEIEENISWKVFLSFYIQLRSIINNAGEMIMELNFYLEEIQVQLNMLSLGKLAPITVKPDKLKHILFDIQDKLPEPLRLPMNPKSNIWEYYRMLTCSVVFDSDKIFIIVSIPLIDRRNQFEVYSVHNLPIPNTAFSPSTLPEGSLKKKHLVANYYLEAKAIAINKERTNYIELTDEESKRCSNSLVSFCEFKSPIYPVNWSKLGLVALLTGSETRIRQVCKAKVFTNELLPAAEYIADGTWVVISAEKLTFTKTCQNQFSGPNTFYVKPPLAFVKLNETCSASNNHMLLPPYYKLKSLMNLEVDYGVLKELVAKVNFSNIQLWQPINKVINKVNFSYHFDRLKDIGEMKMEHLIDEINSFEEISNDNNEFWNWKSIVFIIGVAILFIFILLIIFKRNSIKKGYKFWFKNKDNGTNDFDTKSLTDIAGPVPRPRPLTARKRQKRPTNTAERQTGYDSTLTSPQTDIEMSAINPLLRQNLPDMEPDEAPPKMPKRNRTDPLRQLYP